MSARRYVIQMKVAPERYRLSDAARFCCIYYCAMSRYHADDAKEPDEDRKGCLSIKICLIRRNRSLQTADRCPRWRIALFMPNRAPTPPPRRADICLFATLRWRHFSSTTCLSSRLSPTAYFSLSSEIHSMMPLFHDIFFRHDATMPFSPIFTTLPLFFLDCCPRCHRVRFAFSATTYHADTLFR